MTRDLDRLGSEPFDLLVIGGGIHGLAAAYDAAGRGLRVALAERGDFGSNVVEDLGPDDAFVALVEFGPECAGTPLYARQGLPRRLRSRAFNRRALQRTLEGQAGQQLFFTEAGRAFCLYVVLGRDHDLGPLLDRVHAALDGIELG